jgi:hypothetical protein
MKVVILTDWMKAHNKEFRPTWADMFKYNKDEKVLAENIECLKGVLRHDESTKTYTNREA